MLKADELDTTEIRMIIAGLPLEQRKALVRSIISDLRDTTRALEMASRVISGEIRYCRSCEYMRTPQCTWTTWEFATSENDLACAHYFERGQVL